MVEPISAGLTSLKAAFDLSKAMLDVRDAVQVQAKVFELQREILSAQHSALAAVQEKAAMLDEIRALKEELREIKQWDGTKGAYKLQNVWNGAMAYVSQSSGEGADPAHWLCVSCYDKRQKSVLQAKGRDPRDNGLQVWSCSNCKYEIRVSYTVRPDKPWQPTRPAA